MFQVILLLTGRVNTLNGAALLLAPLPAERWGSETVPLLVIAALLGWAFWNIRK